MYFEPKDFNTQILASVIENLNYSIIVSYANIKNHHCVILVYLLGPIFIM